MLDRRKYHGIWYKKNKERVRKHKNLLAKRWYHNNKEKHVGYRRKYARKKQEERYDKFKDKRCPACQRPLFTIEKRIYKTKKYCGYYCRRNLKTSKKYRNLSISQIIGKINKTRPKELDWLKLRRIRDNLRTNIVYYKGKIKSKKPTYKRDKERLNEARKQLKEVLWNIHCRQ